MTKTKTILLVFSLFSLAALSGSLWSFFQKDITPGGIRITAPTDKSVSQKGTAPRTAFVKEDSSSTPANLATTPLLDLEWEPVVNKDGATKYKNGDLVITPDKELRIAASAVTSAAIRRHTIEASDIDTNSITSRTIRDSTIQGQDIDPTTTIEVATITAEYGSFQTISAGIWNASMITTAYGGTGLDGSSANNGTLLIGNGSGYTLATITDGSGITVSNGSGSITIASTLGTIIDLTSEVTGILPLANGGTNASTIGSAGSIPYSTGTAYAFSAVGTAGQVLVSGGSSTPTWNTLGAASISADSLDFTEFKDALTLDASTDISITGTNFLSLTNTGTGNSFVVNDVASDTTPFVINAAGDAGIGTTSPDSKLSVRLSSSEIFKNPFKITSDGANTDLFNVDNQGIVTINTISSSSGYGGLIVNASGITPPTVPHNSSVHIVSGTNDFAALYIDSFGNNADAGSYRSLINLRAARGTVSVPLANAAGDELGRISGRGYSGTAFTGSISSISFYSAETLTSSAQGSYMTFRTTAIGSIGGGTYATPPEVVRIQPSGGMSIGNSTFNATDPGHGFLTMSGNLGIGDTTPTAALTVGSGDLFQVNSTGAVAAATGITSSGTITFSGLTAGGVVQAASGTGLLSVGTLGASGITADTLDFTELQDQLDLDASTDILADGAEVFSVTNTGTGNSFTVNDAASDTTPFVIDASGRVIITRGTVSDSSNSLQVLSTRTADFNGGNIFNPTNNIYSTFTVTPTVDDAGIFASTLSKLTLTGSVAYTGSMIGAENYVKNNSTAALGEMYGSYNKVEHNSNAVVTNAYGSYNDVYSSSLTVNAITNAYGVYSHVGGVFSSATIANGYGLYVSMDTVNITNPYAVYTSGGGEIVF